MTDWKGIFTHTSPVDDRDGISEWQANTRLRKAGELQRRDGMLSSAIAKQAGPIYEIVSASGLGANFLTFDLGGTITGFSTGGGGDTLPPQPPGKRIRRVRGTGGVPTAPVITAVVASPTSPRAYVAGVVTFTPSITYDGLSGALSYNWQQTVGPAAPFPPSSVASTFVTDFNGFCIPGLYQFQLTVTTALNGFIATYSPIDFTVT